MPRVSEEHLERRRRQILDAARRCFVRKGFHETSMQDIFAEAELSAGAVYRYFKSKNEIIEAIAYGTIGNMQVFLDQLVHQDPLPSLEHVTGAFAELIVSLTDEDGPARLAPQAWALALYDPEIGRHVRASMEGLRELWITYVGRLRDEGHLPPDSDTTAMGKVLFGLLPGFVLQHLILGDIDPDELRRGVHQLGTRTSTPA